MATITEKNGRRFRVQFTLSRHLHAVYTQNMKMAENLQVNIDFSRDFEKWLAAQLEQTMRDLTQLSAKVEADSTSIERKTRTKKTSAATDDAFSSIIGDETDSYAHNLADDTDTEQLFGTGEAPLSEDN